MKLKWSSKPPRIAGWWFVGAMHKKGGEIHVRLVEVWQRKQEWQWSFLGGMTWNNTDNYPHYKWAGPLRCPTRAEFLKAK